MCIRDSVRSAAAHVAHDKCVIGINRVIDAGINRITLRRRGVSRVVRGPVSYTHLDIAAVGDRKLDHHKAVVGDTRVVRLAKLREDLRIDHGVSKLPHCGLFARRHSGSLVRYRRFRTPGAPVDPQQRYTEQWEN